MVMLLYVQVNSLRLKSSVASKWAGKHLWGTIYFAVDGTYLDISFLKCNQFLDYLAYMAVGILYFIEEHRSN